MDTERLRQLKRQKELLLGHLDWIDQEIARESLQGGDSPGSQFNRLSVGSERVTADRSLTATRIEVDAMSPALVASDLYSELGPDTAGSVNETKRGCLLLTATAFCLFAALVVAIFLWY